MNRPIVKVIPCGVHTCFQTFTTLQEYSNHYNRRHMYVCGTCKKSLPTSHILELHVLELHDTYFAMSVPKKPMVSFCNIFIVLLNCLVVL